MVVDPLALRDLALWYWKQQKPWAMVYNSFVLTSLSNLRANLFANLYPHPCSGRRKTTFAKKTPQFRHWLEQLRWNLACIMTVCPSSSESCASTSALWSTRSWTTRTRSCQPISRCRNLEGEDLHNRVTSRALQEELVGPESKTKWWKYNKVQRRSNKHMPQASNKADEHMPHWPNRWRKKSYMQRYKHNKHSIGAKTRPKNQNYEYNIIM